MKKPQNTTFVVQPSHTEQLHPVSLDQYCMVEEEPVQSSAVGHPHPPTAPKEIDPGGQCPEQVTRLKNDRKQREVYNASTGKCTKTQYVPEGI